ncbi:hypothetical protein [Actinoplanes sp. HUAS TT8]|uniref:hypothetical protein n=1 Tax=Actinoplanes sp. HUAS TT8 TaxID=3447453 RepID=UPI003F524725
MRCQFLIGSVLVAGALAVPSAAQADPAITTPARYELPTTDAVTDVLAVGPEVWVAAGNTVLITSATGRVRTTVTGLLGAKGLTPSPDGTSVYVSESTAGKIARVSTAGEVLGSWTSQACPGRSSIVGGALYYAYSCDVETGGVGRLDLTDHTDRSVLTDSDLGGLTGAGSRVITYPRRGVAGTATAYTAAGDGTLTKGNSAALDAADDVEISPDSTRFLVTQSASENGVARYNSATMTKDGDFPTGPHATAVAWSPDGARFAGLIDTAVDQRPVHIFDAAGGTELVTSPVAGTNSYFNPAGTASWSADGSTIFSIAQEFGNAPTLVATPTAGQVATTVSATVAPAKAYGKNLTITVRTPGRSRVAATVSVRQNGVTTVAGITTSATGIAYLSLAARGNGKVTVNTAADAKYLPATTTASFTTPSALSLTLMHGTTKRGVVHYRSIGAVLGAFGVLPKRSAKVTVTLQHKVGTSWRTDGNIVLTTASDGRVGVVLKRGNKKVIYRFLGRAGADTVAAASPPVASRPFIID